MDPCPHCSAPYYRGAGKLVGKVALITGGDSGIGRAVAILYAREGADVAIVYLEAEQSDAEETQAAVAREGKRAILIPGDVCEPRFCDEAALTTVRELGKLDILVNNAAYQMNQRARSTTSRSSSSTRPSAPTCMLIDYSATKGAIHTMTKSLSAMLLPKGIRVNCVVPGPIWTPLQTVPLAKLSE